MLTRISGMEAMPPKISIPFSVFLDRFGLYRNAYHSLKGMYITPAGLDVDNRTSLNNLFVLMIGPFGTNELNMAACLQPDSIAMGAGKDLILETGERVFVTAFPLLFTGDMPQQNQNYGNKTHNAEFGCRSCFVPDIQRGNLFLDVFASARYRAPTRKLFDNIASLRTKAARAAAQQKYGLTPEGPYFSMCYPMLDPQRANPNDPLHAELRLCKYFSEALLEGILSPSGILAYRTAWNSINVPYRWGQPQNPVSHKGSMVFSEHGQMAIMNPFVLLHLFTTQDAKSRKSYLKASAEGRLKTSFDDGVVGREPSHQVLRTGFMLAKTVYLTLKRSLTQREKAEFDVTIIEVIYNSPRFMIDDDLIRCLQMRIMLRKFFKSTITTKGGFQKYADVPNIHLALHYKQDMENFATTYNSTTMMGEQKHKVFKQHAQHTNSHENDLQLLKAINISQTLRFIFDGTFRNSESHSRISVQVRKVVGKCPILRERFLGFRGAAKPSFLGEAGSQESQCLGIDVSGIDISGSLFLSSRTGSPVALTRIQTTDKQSNLVALQNVYQQEYNINLQSHSALRPKVHYWAYFTGQPSRRSHEFDGQHQFRVRIEWFVRLRDNLGAHSFYRVRRIFTVTIGTLVRVFFVLGVLQRDMSQEIEAAPYRVFKNSGQKQEVARNRRLSAFRS